MGQRIIGLTGGIATGKSTVADYLQQHHGLPVLDADVYARQVVAPGSVVLGAIADRYGPILLLPDGQLDRARLGDIIFNQPAEKTWLEAQIHPRVSQAMAAAMAVLGDHPTVVQVIPLLFEAQLTHQVTEIWVVTCRPEQQYQRLIQRSGLNPDQAQARIRSQIPLTEKAARADWLLDNSGDQPTLFRQVDQALQQGP
ncbi:MAG: dephospho-CoA kinase [Nodosilinea sp.]